MQTISPTGAMILEQTYYGYKSVNCSSDTPVRIYKIGNAENRMWMPEEIGRAHV